MARDPLSVDFSKEEASSGGGGIRNFDGQVLVKITSIKPGTSEQQGTPFVEVSGTVLKSAGSKNLKGKKVRERFYLSPKSLPRLRLLLEAVGCKVPKSKFKIPRDKVVGKTVCFEMEVDDDSEKNYSKVTFEGIMKASEFDEDYEPDDDEDDDDEDDEDEDDEVDFDEMDLDELRAYNKEHSLGVKGLKAMTLKKARKAVAAAAEDDDEDLEELDVEDM